MRPQAGGGATPITPKNGFSGRSSPHGMPADHPLAVERDVEQPRLVEIVGQGAGQRLDQIVAPVLPELDVEDVDLQHVAGRGAFDRDRAGQDMARHHALVLGVDVGKLRRDVKFAAVRHHVGAAGDGVDGDFIAAGDGQDGLQFRFEKAPVAGFGAGMQVMMGHEGFFQALSVIAGHSRPQDASLVPDPAIHHFAESFVKIDGYAGQARV